MEPATPRRRQRPRMEKPPRRGSVMLTIILVIALVIVAFGAGALVMLKLGKQSPQVESRMVNFGLEDIGELATQAGFFTNVQTIEDDKKFFGHKIPFTGSKSIFSYDGTIKAGIDFSQISIDVDDFRKLITVKIPKAKILSSEIDNDSLAVYDEKQSIFTPLTIDAYNVSQQKLKEEVREKAISHGILTNANENAKILIRAFLAGAYNLKEYKIVFYEK